MKDCSVCNRRCRLKEGETGFCGTRKLIGGKIESIVYGRIASLQISPIEIKPLYHYYPGSKWLSIGTLGCNFYCNGCQNWQLSHANIEKELNKITYYISPHKLIDYAKKQKCIGISFTYNEPTLWLEYTLDVFKLAKSNSLLTNYVTNGYMSPEAMNMLGNLLDSFRVDLKGFSHKTYQGLAGISNYELILNNIKEAKHKWGMHIEIITNIIPNINDKKDELIEMIKWIKGVIGKETPWHITRFFPAYKLNSLPATPIDLLISIYNTGKENDLDYVYLGNVVGHKYENTYCPNCNNILIERFNYKILCNFIKNGKCNYCNYKIYGCFF